MANPKFLSTCNQLSGKLFPVHRKPKCDELLSSWIVRLSLAHGLPLADFVSNFPLERKLYISNIKDIDLNVRTHKLNPNTRMTAFLEALSEKTATPIKRVRETTLDEYEGRLYHKLFNSKLYSWIAPCDFSMYGGKDKFGMQACPLCLAEDKEPYFRRSWRLAFVVSCPQHQCLLVDRCPTCGEPIRFQRNALQWFHSPIKAMTRCCKCQFDFRALSRLNPQTDEIRAVEPQILEFQEYLVRAAKQGYVEVQGVDNISAEELFNSLHWILSIVIMPYAAVNRVRTLIFNYYGVTLDCSLLPKEQTVESLSVGTRAELLLLLQRLLIDHPQKYFESSRPRDLLSRIWLDAWQQTLCWRLGVVWAQPARHTRKGIYANRDQVTVTRRKETAVLESSDSYKRMAMQLDSAGFRRSHIARILRVHNVIAGQWIKESHS